MRAWSVRNPISIEVLETLDAIDRPSAFVEGLSHSGDGRLKELNIVREANNYGNYMAWKMTNKGKGLQVLIKQFMAAQW